MWFNAYAVRAGGCKPKPPSCLLLLYHNIQSANVATRPSHGEHGGDHRLEMEGTTEDRLLLAGLRRLGDHDRTPRGRSDPASPRKGELIHTFRHSLLFE